MGPLGRLPYVGQGRALSDECCLTQGPKCFHFSMGNTVTKMSLAIITKTAIMGLHTTWWPPSPVFPIENNVNFGRLQTVPIRPSTFLSHALFSSEDLFRLIPGGLGKIQEGGSNGGGPIIEFVVFVTLGGPYA